MISCKTETVLSSFVGEMACNVASRCRQPIPVDTSLDCRVWQASINGVTKCGRRIRSDGNLLLAYEGIGQSKRKTDQLWSETRKSKVTTSNRTRTVQLPTQMVSCDFKIIKKVAWMRVSLHFWDRSTCALTPVSDMRALSAVSERTYPIQRDNNHFLWICICHVWL